MSTLAAFAIRWSISPVFLPGRGFSALPSVVQFLAGVTPPTPKRPHALSAPGSSDMHSIPASLNRYLRDYQREGAQFLYELYIQKKGGLLCDDMGLGKTVQVIAFLSAIFKKTGIPSDMGTRKQFLRSGNDPDDESCLRVLIVAPSSVVYNWEREFATWGYFNVGIYHGAKKEVVLKKAVKGTCEVVITSFDTCRNNSVAIDEIPWTMMIIDEVHKLKEDSAQITQCMKAFHVKRRYGLTGTAIQNKYKELWCLLDWCNKGCVGSAKEFEKEISMALKRGQAFGATKAELALARVVFCPLTATQLQVYENLLTSPNFDLLIRKDDPCDCEEAKGDPNPPLRGECCYVTNAIGTHWKHLVLPNLVALQKVSNHLALIMPSPDEDKEKRL
ncbi:P-loop containing nucleoside triphosphate hydrolase protein, partial [Blyttiomyces helicus]